MLFFTRFLIIFGMIIWDEVYRSKRVTEGTTVYPTTSSLPSAHKEWPWPWIDQCYGSEFPRENELPHEELNDRVLIENSCKTDHTSNVCKRWCLLIELELVGPVFANGTEAVRGVQVATWKNETFVELSDVDFEHDLEQYWTIGADVNKFVKESCDAIGAPLLVTFETKEPETKEGSIEEVEDDLYEEEIKKELNMSHTFDHSNSRRQCHQLNKKESVKLKRFVDCIYQAAQTCR